MAIHEQSSIHHRHLIKGFFTLGIKVIQMESSCRGVQGHLPRKAKNKLEAQFHYGCKLHFGEIHTSSTFSCWKIRFNTQVSSYSGSPSEAMLWIKEVEIVDAVDDLKIIAIN